MNLYILATLRGSSRPPTNPPYPTHPTRIGQAPNQPGWMGLTGPPSPPPHTHTQTVVWRGWYIGIEIQIHQQQIMTINRILFSTNGIHQMIEILWISDASV